MPDNNQNNNNRPGGPNNGKDPKKQNIFILIMAAVLSLILFLGIMNLLSGSTEKEITYSEFITMLEEGKIESVDIASDRIFIVPKAEEKENEDTGLFAFIYGYSMMSEDMTYYTGKIEDDDTLTGRLLKKGVEVNGKVTNSSSVLLSIFLNYILPILIMWILLSFLFRKMSKSGGGGGLFNVGCQ